MTQPTLDFSRFHDAELVGLSIAREARQLRFDFLTEGGEKLGLSIVGVHLFRAVDVRIQNVVSRIVSTRQRNTAQAEIVSALKWATEMVDAPSHLSREVAATYLEKINDGTLCLLLIEPSAGGDIAVLAEGVTIESASQTV